jgi:hypothetical protein
MSLSFDFGTLIAGVFGGADGSGDFLAPDIWHLLNLLELYCLSLFKMVFYNYGLFCPT